MANSESEGEEEEEDESQKDHNEKSDNDFDEDVVSDGEEKTASAPVAAEETTKLSRKEQKRLQKKVS